MKTLYTNGCSWTYGDELQEPQNTAWPVILSDKFGHSLINEAVNGGSNFHILRKTMWFIFDWIENDKSLSDLMVVIGWTNPGRLDVPYDTGNGMDYMGLYPSVTPNNRYWKRYHKNWLEKHCWEDDFIWEYIRQLLFLSSFLEKHDIPYLFFSSFGAVEYDINDKLPNILNGKWARRLFKDVSILDETFSSFAYSNNFEIGKRNHPLEEAHEGWANYLYEKFSENII